MSTATPIIDTAARHIDGFADKWVPRYVSEELERELASAQAEKEKWEQIACDKLIEVCMQIEEKKIVTEQRDRLAEALDDVMNSGDSTTMYRRAKVALQSLTNQNEI
jgi:hypothetical protein